MDNYTVEYGGLGQFVQPESKMYYENGEVVMCACGKEAVNFIVGKEAYIARCNECMGYKVNEIDHA